MAYCEFSDQNWAVIMRRETGALDINTRWRYVVGFGDIRAEFFQGIMLIF